MVARLAAWFHTARLLFLKIVHEFRDDSLFHAKLFQAGMRERSIDSGEPW
jgi:hypothetical protein